MPDQGRDNLIRL